MYAIIAARNARIVMFRPSGLNQKLQVCIKLAWEEPNAWTEALQDPAQHWLGCTVRGSVHDSLSLSLYGSRDPKLYWKKGKSQNLESPNLLK